MDSAKLNSACHAALPVQSLNNEARQTADKYGWAECPAADYLVSSLLKYSGII
jgi:hypothetical protein